ncbi:MAG: 30S ribosomal protein S17 [Parcubacteria group bacterium]|nr:30S ribosomal protein S17 [Parcubacteria group bacterium]
MSKRILKGQIVSEKMDKTRVVLVERLKEHPKYKKRYKISRRYKAHDEKNEYHIGDQVYIEETKPMSRDKRWIVVKKI